MANKPFRADPIRVDRFVWSADNVTFEEKKTTYTPPATIEGKAAFIDADDPLSQDLRTWQKLAMRRYKAGDVTKALNFKQDVIPPILHAAIRGALDTVTTPDEIYTVFDDADRWVRHDAGTAQ